MSTEETKLAIEALERDLERYNDSVDDGDTVRAERIKARMVDTINQTIKDDTDHEQVMQIIGIVNGLFDLPGVTA